MRVRKIYRICSRYIQTESVFRKCPILFYPCIPYYFIFIVRRYIYIFLQPLRICSYDRITIFFLRFVRRTEITHIYIYKISVAYKIIV